MIKQHLYQCNKISKNAYGKKTTSTLDYYGLDNGIDMNLLISRYVFNSTYDTKTAKVKSNAIFREKNCCKIKGIIESIQDGMVKVCFSLNNVANEIFYAHTPISGLNNDVAEGSVVEFYLGFSYEGFRVWDTSSIDDKKDDIEFN